MPKLVLALGLGFAWALFDPERLIRQENALYTKLIGAQSSDV